MADLKARNLIARDLFPIPENPTVEGTKCITLQIPDDMEHEAVFAGALALLTKWNSWQKDGTTNARDAANTWKAALEAGIEACMSAVTDVRQNEDNPCTLEKQIDGGAWVEFADLQLCQPRVRRHHGIIQWFDGTSWVDMPDDGDDPEDGTIDPQWTDPPEGETGNCLAAENITALLQQQVLEWGNALTAGAIALGIVTIITGVLTAFFIPPATPALLGFGTVLVGLGASGLSSAFTEEVYDRFKCIIACRAQSDGSITVEDYSFILVDIHAESGTAWDLIETWLSFFGAVGLTRAASSAGITSGDCDDCECFDVLIAGVSSGTVNKVEVKYGETFELTLGALEGPFYHYNGAATLTPCAKIELVSVTNYNPGGHGGTETVWVYYDCASSPTYFLDTYHIPTDATPFIGGNSLTQAVFTFRVLPA